MLTIEQSEWDLSKDRPTCHVTAKIDMEVVYCNHTHADKEPGFFCKQAIQNMVEAAVEGTNWITKLQDFKLPK